MQQSLGKVRLIIDECHQQIIDQLRFADMSKAIGEPMMELVRKPEEKFFSQVRLTPAIVKG